jgi:SpoVK/Ycf46/Vps4 family AAA+-type ATPase
MNNNYKQFLDTMDYNSYNKNCYKLWNKKKQNNITNNERKKYIDNVIKWNNLLYECYINDNLKKHIIYDKIVPKKTININVEINNINDIINIIEKYKIDPNIEYNINLEALHKIKLPLIELNNMIGMNNLKENIIDQILFYIQNLQHETNDFMHTCIYGPPGTGKTEIAKIIGKIFCNLGVLKKNTFHKVTRSDLIAGYLGQTSIKTKNVIMEALGGVLFIDEAYALGNIEKRDSFAKECIDTLCECLSNYKEQLMVIIAGYEKDLNDCFFAYNQGLNSRFTWRFKTDSYSCKELREILHKKIREIGWSLEDDDIPKLYWFEKNKDYFKYYGRDMETLLSKIKICHSRRVFLLDNSKKKIITQKDIDNGFNKFLDNDEVKNRNTKDHFYFQNMYV